MPGGNRMGPLGAGPMTGRGAGYCAGGGAAGNITAGGRFCGFGRGRGGRGGGGGRGCRNMFFATGLPGWARFDCAPAAETADEKQMLTNQADALRTQLDNIQKRLERLE